MTTPIIQLLHTAYQAQAAIERMRDPDTIAVATAALSFHAMTILKTAPEHQVAASGIRDERGQSVPTLSELYQAYLTSYIDIYTRLHNATPAAA